MAGRREPREESGLNVEIKTIVRVMTDYLSPGLHTLVVVLLAHVVDGELLAGDDLEAAQWYR